MSKPYRKENNCLNCGNDVNGKFCSNCGQENIEIREPFWTFVSHGVGHYFHYDSKFKNTLRPFLTKPGQLTKDHMEGRRASHIPPISLYLFITLVYFLCAPIFKEKKENTTRYNHKYDERTGKLEEAKSRHDLQNLEEDSIYSTFEKYSFQRQEVEIAKLDSQIHVQGKDTSGAQSDILKEFNRLHASKLDSTVEAYRIRQAGLPESDRDNWLNRFWREQKIDYKVHSGANGNISEVMDKYFPKMLFILMPLFAFFLMLNFRRNKKLYMEHLIYTIHLFSFAFLSFLVSEFLVYITPPDVGAIIGVVSLAILVWYTYRSIRVVYERSRWVSVRKLFSVSILFLTAFVITYVLGMLTLFVFT